MYIILQGRTSLLQQLLFLESLLDLVEAASSKESVPQLEGSCRFADTLCASERLDSSVFAQSLNLLPADIGHHLDSRVVSGEELKSEAESLCSQLEDRQSELHSILQQHRYEEVNTAVMHSCVKTLTVSLGTLAQMVTNFCQSYEVELQPWVGHRQPPTLGPLGPLCKRTATLWNHISKILNSLQQLETTLQGLQSMPAMDMYPACHKAQETLQQCIDMVVPVISTI
ncbi:hypothetical protein GBAR_LOCUS13321 [Geodia barretti]|uniref:Uncharacterized protein n=1 Tax=Geodia barretti TaxID=519541 RepID=A0AA35S4C4_GEOBA|nr:hypothetical protein GBAR_LOCUS13321 [Geodia barretti]